jgi:pimeloyl-ACP methyl ester carboxylesterase
MILPGFGLENAVRFGPDGFGLWHLAFHAATEVPEMLIAGGEREYLGWFFRHHAATPTAIPAEDIEVYAANYRQPGAARAAMGFYRALYESAQQNRRLAARKLTISVLALGGAQSIGSGVAACMRQVAVNVEAGVVTGAGHWVGRNSRSKSPGSSPPPSPPIRPKA